jgi:preprotein translocase subunit SecD
LRRQNLRVLIIIVVMVVAAIWIVMPSNPGLHLKIGPLEINKPIEIRQGLDLQGGLQVLLEADLPPGEEMTAEAMGAARTIVENRVNGLGVTEPVVQQQGDRRIIVELPGISNPDEAIATLRETGLLEFVEAGRTSLEEGTVVRTTYGGGMPVAPSEGVTGTAAVTDTEALLSDTTPLTDTAPLTETAPIAAPTNKIYETIMTGKDLESANVALDEYGQPEILFKLKSSGTKVFADYTAKHVGDILAIVLDKRVISAPVIQSPIPDGSGRITGRFTLEEARAIGLQLRYGALPVPLKVESIRAVGPTLGRDSINKSIRAGAIGLMTVFLFMLIYYRLPGGLADVALIVYALLNFAIYKWGIPTFGSPFFAPVTLTLPGITGFLLSTGMAVDANILIFERMKEELRAGRSLGAAIDAGFDRAWTSIRDSNLSALITCVILYWFGSNFGASAVKGFAITLFIGVCISMFTAIIVTRTLVRFVFDVWGEKLRDNKWLVGF